MGVEIKEENRVAGLGPEVKILHHHDWRTADEHAQILCNTQSTKWLGGVALVNRSQMELDIHNVVSNRDDAVQEGKLSQKQMVKASFWLHHQSWPTQLHELLYYSHVMHPGIQSLAAAQWINEVEKQLMIMFPPRLPKPPLRSLFRKVKDVTRTSVTRSAVPVDEERCWQPVRILCHFTFVVIKVLRKHRQLNYYLLVFQRTLMSNKAEHPKNVYMDPTGS